MGKDNFGSGKSNNQACTKLHEGLKNRAASDGPSTGKGSRDKSYGPPKGSGSVNTNTTRTSTARTPKSLGPRTA